MTPATPFRRFCSVRWSKPGRYEQPINHYNVLRTIEDMYGLPSAGRSRGAEALEGCWRT